MSSIYECVKVTVVTVFPSIPHVGKHTKSWNSLYESTLSTLMHLYAVAITLNIKAFNYFKIFVLDCPKTQHQHIGLVY